MFHPEFIIEATGVCSRRSEAFLKNNSFTYTWLNPLEAKEQFKAQKNE